MARIPEEEIEQLKREVSIVDLVKARGVKLRGQGDNLMGLCPMHDDREPSLVVSPEKNIWHCLGACQSGGSVLDWVMKASHVSFRAAVEMLRSRAPSLAAEMPTTRAKLNELVAPDAADRVVLRRVVDFYHETLKQSADALAYLEKRGLRSSEAIERFCLGYANRTLAYRLPTKRIRAGEAMRTQLQRLGVLRKSGHEHLTGAVVIPIFSEDGEVLELYGRRIESDRRKQTPDHLYLPRRADGRRGVFNLSGLRGTKEVILCEALIDALTFACAGYTNVTSAYGVEGFTDELRDVLRERGIERVLIAYDRDEAGDRAAKKLAGELSKDGFEIFRVLFPKGMDANEYAQKVQPARKSLATAIESAQWIAGKRPVAVLSDLTPQLPAHASPEEMIGNADDELSDRTGQPTEAPREDRAMANGTGIVVAVASPVLDIGDKVAGDDVAAGTSSKVEPSSLAAAPSPASSSSAAKLEAEVSDDEARMRLGDRRWRIRGLSKSSAYATLRLTVFVSRGESVFVDTLELYNARQRAAFLKQAAAELGVEEQVLKSDVGKIVLRLEELVEERLAAALHPKPAFTMTEEAKDEALALLRDPRLLDRILEDFDRAGVVGEETNKLIGYIAAISRKLEAPLAVVIQSSSAAGKSSLMDAVLRFMPEEERVQYSAMTGQSLFYMGETDLAHKILAVSEEHGVQSAVYALKLLQSEGQLTIASTGKDPVTGKLVTQEYRVQGPVMIFLTTTAIEVDEELLNRCLILTVDEGAKQTSAIHERQRESQTLEGLLRRHDCEHVIALHQNAQRLLDPLLVANPFAKELRFSSSATRARRDHMKYLTLIRATALLHQHQREVKTVAHRGQLLRYIEVTRADIAIADKLATAVLGHDADEMPPQTRRLLELVDAMVSAAAKQQAIEKSAVRFTRKDIRAFTKWSNSSLKKHLARLEDLEHLLQHGGGGARRRALYELAIDTYERSGHPENPSWSPQNSDWSPLGRPSVTPEARPVSLEDSRKKRELATPKSEARLGTAEHKRSYTDPSSSKRNGEARP